MARSPHVGLSRREFLSLAAAVPLVARVSQRSAAVAGQVRFLRYDDVAAIVTSPELKLPPEFEGKPASAIREEWPRWVEREDVALKARLQRGEEDTLANFVLLGVSFTPQKRITPDLTDPDQFDRYMRARVQNFVDALAEPGQDERLQLLRNLVERLGFSTAAGEARERLADYVMLNIERYMVERQRYASVAARSARNGTLSPLSATSEIYKDRGLSVDTDFRPNFAIEAALAEVKRRGLLKTVRRVAIIGPGLDFTDKDAGFDYYPLQTLQPFAVFDSLLKLGMASAPELKVSLFDVSSPVLDHVRRAVTRARSGQRYTLQLVLNEATPWSQEVLDYWQSFGARIGTTTVPMALPPQVRDARPRAMSIRPDVVAAMEPIAMNVVLQRDLVPADRQFDLVIGTNILVYYSAFQQALALSNVDSMLSASGVFLTNDVDREFPGVRLRPGGIVRATYFPGQTDQVRIYTRSTFRPQLPPL